MSGDLLEITRLTSGPDLVAVRPRLLDSRAAAHPLGLLVAVAGSGLGLIALGFVGFGLFQRFGGDTCGVPPSRDARP